MELSRRAVVAGAVAIPVAANVLGLPTMPAAKAATLPLASKKWLFLDDTHLVTRTNAQILSNRPEREELVLIADKAWEANGITSNASVFYDTIANEYRMYYFAVHDWPSSTKWNMCLATSQDGVTWAKPNLGLVTFNSSTNNNIVLSN